MDKERQVNLDYFRIIVMLFILSLHFLGVGGAFYNINDGDLSLITSNYQMSALVEAFAIVGVNCFVILSGYFLVNSKFKMEKLISLVVKTFIYSVGIGSIIFLVTQPEFSLNSLIRAVFPISMSSYWFITVYIVLYIFSPYLNKLILNLEKDDFKKLVILSIIIFSAWKTLMPIAETLDTSKGYGIIWFVVLYFIGAYIKLHYKIKYTSRVYLFTYVIISLFIYFVKIIFIILSSKVPFFAQAQNMFYHYNSLTVLFSSITLFLAFLSWKNAREVKLISKISTMTIAVYLIHEHFMFREILWLDLVKVPEMYYSSFYIIEMIISIIVVFLLCIAIEMFVNKIVVWITVRLEKVYRRRYELFRQNKRDRV